MEDFNLPSPQRVALLESLQMSIGEVPPHFWAACQICDLKSLEILANCGQQFPHILRGFTTLTSKMVHYCGPNPPKSQSQASTPKNQTPHRTTPTLSTSSATPPLKRQKTSDSPATQQRNRKARDLAKERDGSICVLTGSASIEVAHIYPFHSISQPEADKFGHRHVFWDHLKNFWPEEKIKVWEESLFPRGLCESGIERAYNLVTLSRAAHDIWARGAFALKPISCDAEGTTLKVQFFWQKKQQEGQTAMSLLTTPFSTEGLDHNMDVFGGPVARLIKEDKLEAIQSGEYFTLRTDDPETKPLPSFALLELQWFLQRIMGMAGAADVEWPSLSESGSDYSDMELADLEFDEEEDIFSSLPLRFPTQLVYNNNSNLLNLKHQEANGEAAEQGMAMQD